MIIRELWLFVNASTMLVHMNSGQLLRVESFQDRPAISVFYDGRNTFRNGYAKMAVAKDGEKHVAVGSLEGWVMVFDALGRTLNRFQVDFNKNNKILQILWLNKTLSSKLLVCIPDGMMVSNDFKRSLKTSRVVVSPLSKVVTGAFSFPIVSLCENHRLRLILFRDQRFLMSFSSCWERELGFSLLYEYASTRLLV